MNLSRTQLFVLGVVLLFISYHVDAAGTLVNPVKKPLQTECVPVGSWMVPGGEEVTNTEIISRAAKSDVVLLGETHVNKEHHRWQLQTLAALHAVRPDMVIGFEMFPRRVQSVLDQWVAGELTEKEFLRDAQWGLVWSTDADLYLPLFHFARMNHIPMRALNVETSLRRKVSEKGFYGVPVEDREGLTRPAEPSVEYLDFLLPIYKQHDREYKTKGEVNHDDPDFRRFISGQQLWDRAMAEVIYAAIDDSDEADQPLVVGVMGSGHILHGYGVPHQLRDLGVNDIISLLPWDAGRSCKRFVSGFADAVFGVVPYVSQVSQPMRQRLGIRFEFAHGGGHVLQVEKDSIAETAGLKEADVIMKIAGLEIKDIGDVINVIKRHAPGTWLPLEVKRGDKTIDVVAKFPALEN